MECPGQKRWGGGQILLRRISKLFMVYSQKGQELDYKYKLSIWGETDQHTIVKWTKNIPKEVTKEIQVTNKKDRSYILIIK